MGVQRPQGRRLAVSAEVEGASRGAEASQGNPPRQWPAGNSFTGEPPQALKIRGEGGRKAASSAESRVSRGNPSESRGKP